MGIKFEGSYPDIERLETGFYSLDRAFVGVGTPIGVPIGHGFEIFGTNHTGKSSFTYCLAGLIAKAKKGGIVLCDFEGFQRDLIKCFLENVGFDGTFYSAKREKDEDQLDEMLQLLEKKYAVGILDSIGAISPIAEQAGDLGEANMGRRAFIMAQFCRKGLRLFRFAKTARTILMINHYYPKIGTRGWDTPGGESKKYLASVRIKLQRTEEFPDGSYILKGTVIKNRWGYQDQEFQAFMVAGLGLHRGLSAVLDAVKMKKATRTREKGKKLTSGMISIGDKEYGLVSELVVAAKRGQNEVFNDFYTVLETAETTEPELEPVQDEIIPQDDADIMSEGDE